MTALIAGSHKRPRVLVIGPGRTQVGGVATFVEIVRSSTYLKERYELIHMDTTRGPRGAGVASRFTLINILYFVRQSIVFLLIGFRSRPQIMHVLVTSFWAFWKNAAFILMARLLHMKVVAHLQGGVFDHYYRESSPLAQRLIGWVMRRSDVVVALSNRWRRFLVEEVRSDLNVEVVPNTVDAMFAQAIGKDNGHKGRDPNVVLFVGGLGHRKGIYDILKAVPLVVARQPHVRFLFAGKEEQRGEQAEIDRACAEANLNGTVQFLGEVTGQAKLDLFLNASVFIPTTTSVIFSPTPRRGRRLARPALAGVTGFPQTPSFGTEAPDRLHRDGQGTPCPSWSLTPGRERSTYLSRLLP